MVIPSDGLGPAAAEDGVAKKWVEVVLPVFVKVRLLAEDDLEAEVLSGKVVTAMRQMGPVPLPGGASVHVQAVIGPVVKGGA